MVKSIKDAAEKIEIADGQFLSSWISVGLRDYPELKRRLSSERTTDWGGARPHGILLCNFKELRDRSLVFDNEALDPLPVAGRIAIFGERDASEREPYLAICLIACRDADAGYPEVLRVYAHPCLNWAKWTLVDSKLERETVTRFQSARSRLSKESVEMRVTKPLFDVNQKEPSDDEPVCIPDFLVSILSKPGVPTIVIETMGYSSDRYRNRKIRLRPYFEKIDLLGSGKVAKIEYHDPFSHPNEELSHRSFWTRFYSLVRCLSL